MLLKDKIFDLFGIQAKVDDINKDVNDKGFHQRFQELLAGDLDDNELDLINNFVSNIISPYDLQEKYVIYKEYLMGFDLPISADDYFRKKLYPLLYRLYDIKGSIPAYVQFFRLIGFDTCNITESVASEGFDHDTLTFDSDERPVFDSTGSVSGYYNVVLTGSLPLTDQLRQFIFNVIKINEPINAALNAVTYNGDDVEDIEVSTLGDFNDDFNEDYYI